MWFQHFRKFLPNGGVRPKMPHSHPKVVSIFLCFKIPLTHDTPGKGIGYAGGVRSVVPKMSHSYPKVVSKLFQSWLKVVPTLSQRCLKVVP